MFSGFIQRRVYYIFFAVEFSENKSKLRREKLSHLEGKVKELEQDLSNDEAKKQYNAYNIK